jgi:hypothetical protein
LPYFFQKEEAYAKIVYKKLEIKFQTPPAKLDILNMMSQSNLLMKLSVKLDIKVGRRKY